MLFHCNIYRGKFQIHCVTMAFEQYLQQIDRYGSIADLTGSVDEQTAS